MIREGRFERVCILREGALLTRQPRADATASQDWAAVAALARKLKAQDKSHLLRAPTTPNTAVQIAALNPMKRSMGP